MAEQNLTETTPLVSEEIDKDELQGCGSTLPCNPKRKLHRYLILIILCFISFGTYFCYDNPSALQDNMIRDLDISVSKFMGFYSWYSWPNVILCFFGGFLIDRLFGVRLGAIIFSSCVTVGQFVFALGAMVNMYWLMCVGRFIFGLGGDSLDAANNKYAVKWFQGRELNMVFGLQMSFSRMGSTLNMNVMQPLYHFISRFEAGYIGLGIALCIGGGICILSLFCAFVLGYLDERTDRILKRSKDSKDELICIQDVKDFGTRFWLLCVVCFSYYVSVFPFIGLGLVFFEMKWNMSPSEANIVNSLVYVISAVISPFVGSAIDRVGKSLFWMIFGIVATVVCHILMAFTFTTPFVAMALMGIAYPLLAIALWPLVSMTVAQHQLATAYGIMQAIQNLGLATISIAAGSIVDTKGYLILEIFFLAWLSIALIAAVIVYLIDGAKDGNLNLSTKERRRRAEKKENKSQ